MNGRIAPVLGLVLWLILLTALPTSAEKLAPSTVDATINCSPIKVTAVYERGGGIEPIASGVCTGHIVNPTNLSLTPRWRTFSLEQLNVTGLFSWTIQTGLTVENRTYPPRAIIPVNFRYNPVKLILWRIEGNRAVTVSMNSELLFQFFGSRGRKIG